jgi:Domain of unknown function (DUF1772)
LGTKKASDKGRVLATLAKLLAATSSGLFTGSAVYINLVEHPARMQAGTRVALAEFAPSYKRATVTQVSLATVGFLSALAVWRSSSDARWLIGGGLLVSVIPFTVAVILPTNEKLLDPATANPCCPNAETKPLPSLCATGGLRQRRHPLGPEIS